jgi:formylglycine-generating enzyme required for sulfatase activity
MPPRRKFLSTDPAAGQLLVYSNPERGHHVWRGGSFNNNRRNARSSYRNNNQPDEQNQDLGFRLAGGCGTGITA